MDWLEITSVALTILLFIAGGFIGKLRNVIKEFKEFAVAVQEAILDDKITRAELKRIIQEAHDLKEAALELAKSFNK